MSGAVYKLAFLGEPGAGKSTCIAALSNNGVVSTDVATDELGDRKATTTVALDYGELELADAGRLLLYGLPGQARFRFMFEVVRSGLIGVIVLVDATDARGVAGLDDTLATYADEIRHLPCAVALNKAVDPPAGLREQCAGVLRRHRIVAPVHVIDARRREDIAEVFRVMLMMMELAERPEPAVP